MKKGCQCVDCEHRDYCNKRNKGGVVYCDCYAKGQPMTEQEFIQTCDTEQLAEWMALRLNPGILLALRMKYHCTDINAVREWLKEKHD